MITIMNIAIFTRKFAYICVYYTDVPGKYTDCVIFINTYNSDTLCDDLYLVK